MKSPSSYPARLRAALLAAALGVAASACGDAGQGSGPYPRDGELRFDQVQVLGSHNSYHLQAVPALFAALEAFDASLARSLEYSHAPLTGQLENQGIRQFELDVFYDPAGGRYATPAGKGFIGDTSPPPPELLEPGFKVLHVQDIDFRTTCSTLVACLDEIEAWSDAHPLHVPITILIEAKDDAIPDPLNLGFVVPLPIGAAEFDALDAEIRAALPAEKIITPDEVRGAHATLADAIREDGWPPLGRLRGRILFALDNEGAKRDAYLAGHPSLRGRLLFTSSRPGDPEAAFAKLNDPIRDADLIRELVAAGFVVRTRADSDTEQARTGDVSARDAALASGAQLVSTDYPVPDPRFGTGYQVRIPGGTPGRCNPVSAPVDCTAADVERPDALGPD